MPSAPLLLMAVSVAALSVMDGMVKGLSLDYPTLQVTFMRFLGGALVAIPVALFARPGWPSRDAVMANALRAVLFVVTATLFFYALATLPLAETLVLSFLAPMFIALFGALMLRERVEWRVGVALAVGFAGTLVVIFGPGATAGAARPLSGVLAALLSAVLYALGIVLLRSRSQRDSHMHIVLFQNVGPAILSAPLGISTWTPVAGADMLWFLGIGVLGVFGHILMVRAYAKSPAARLAPMEYTALIWAAGIGYVAFGERPTWATVAGGALIVFAAILTSRRRVPAA